MSYEKHNYQSGAKLFARQLNEMDDQIAANEERSIELNNDLTNIEAQLETTKEKEVFDKTSANRDWLIISNTVDKLIGYSIARSVHIEALPNTTYRINCDVISKKRVGTLGAVPSANLELTNVFRMEEASISEMVITTGENDHFLIVDLFAEADPNHTINDYLESLSIKEETKVSKFLDYEIIKGAISPLVVEENKDLITTFIQGKYIGNNGALIDEGSAYFISGYVDVSKYEVIHVKARANWGNKLYAFYDSDKVYISSEASVTSGTMTSIDKDVFVPSGAVYIVVASRTTATNMALIVNDGYKIKGDWFGKKWTCVGDSLTERNFATTKHYYDYISVKTDVNVNVMGVGGTGYIRGYDHNNAIYQRISNVPTDSDFVTIFGSGNDLNIEAIPQFSGKTFEEALGTYTDSEPTTICGAINKTLDNFFAVCPTTPIGIIAPTPWKDYPTINNNRMVQYVTALHQICDYRGVPFLDLFHSSNLRPENETNRNLCFANGTSLDGNGDGVHPNVLGHKIIASKIFEFSKRLLM